MWLVSSSDLSSRLAVLTMTGTAWSRSIFHIISWSGPGLTYPCHVTPYTSLSFILMASTSCVADPDELPNRTAPEVNFVNWNLSRVKGIGCLLSIAHGIPRWSKQQVKFWGIARDRKLGTGSKVNAHIPQEKGRMMQMATAWWPWTWNGSRFLSGHWNLAIRTWSSAPRQTFCTLGYWHLYLKIRNLCRNLSKKVGFSV